jgi:predicted restriction endonuclease
VAQYWRQAVEHEHALDSDEKLRARRRLHASVTFLGMVRVHGELDPETGETLLTALRAVLDAQAKGMRRAVILRDRRCRFPGCDRPHSWCDAHHVVHWADGGPTAVPNLLLLCRHHHRMVHQAGGFKLGLEEGRAVFSRPDESVLEVRAPP